jgi:alkanesulfonate monooxygenase SsuD/methylene tetrahydromethanopterin reductase-like flavin-dependent oxidoreductase (luciferase family)
MKFGTFILQVSPSPDLDSLIIDNTLRQAQLAEKLGFDAIWLTEHYFAGDTVYADPLVFGAAVATLTKHITIGLAVVQMAFHHPVKLAAQTALLDNLSHGRLIVGTGRGSAYNAYEYMGFGVTVSEGRERMMEAEELLLRSWTDKDLDFNGKYWKVKFPLMRPMTYQKPHPPLIRACLGVDSLREMAKIGRPVLMGIEKPEEYRSRLTLAMKIMREESLSEMVIKRFFENTWVRKSVYVAETTAQAEEEGIEAFQLEREHISEARYKFNPKEYHEDLPLPPATGSDPSHYLMCGSPQSIAEQIGEHRDAGVRNMILGMTPYGLARGKVEKSMELFARKVAPKFR